MKLTRLFRLSLVIAAVGLGGVAMRAEDIGAVKARMEQRISALDALKTRGMAGENNRGYLEARAKVNGAEQKLISDENADRRRVYVTLAQETGSEPETIGRRRAQQIALGSKRGVWIQAPNGEWTQKG